MTNSDKLDINATTAEFARKLGISMDMLPKDVKDSLAFICTSDTPR